MKHEKLQEEIRYLEEQLDDLYELTDFYDTYNGWIEQGYVVMKGERASKHYDGLALFSKSQVTAMDYLQKRKRHMDNHREPLDFDEDAYEADLMFGGDIWH